MPKTPEELKAQKAKQMREYRDKKRAENPEAFLEKQRVDKAKQRKNSGKPLFLKFYTLSPRKVLRLF